MWFKQIKNVISSCGRCSIHNTPAHWKCWCNGGEQGWMSTAHHKEATSVDHNNTFHPFGVKEIRKKTTTWWQRDSHWVGLCVQHQLVPKLQHVRVSQPENMDRGRAGGEEEVREESFVENERKSAPRPSQIPGQQQLTRTYWINTDFTKRLWKLKFTELMSKKHFYRPKAQIFCHPIPFSPH